MKFGDINAAYLFWAFLGVFLFYLWAYKQRQKAMEHFADKNLLKELTASFDIKRRQIKISLFSLALFFSIFALMRPQWGFRWEEVERKALDILIAIDTSKSMLAQDVKPNRLERSKLAVKDLMRRLKGDRIGLIAFAGRSFLQCPLTSDYSGFMLALNDLSISTIPRGGTSLSEAIYLAIKIYEGQGEQEKVLVIITDGEYHEGNPLKAAETAKENGIKIFTIGIGTEEGELIPVFNEYGDSTYLTDKEGNFVKSRLSEDVLQKIALSTGGIYVRATGAEFGLDLIYQKKLSKMEKKEMEGKMRKRYEERFQIPLVFALFLLLLEPFIGERKKI
ncbi:MAG: VWA domain-containing protein [Candidatus Omnitrophica bacterium]|nr:VWA domain-containing protein [Candidatus Omnitrophota bacterium]